MKSLLWPTLILALAALSLSAEPAPGPPPRSERTAQALHLTEAQKAAIQGIRTKHRAELVLHRDAVHQTRTALRTALREAGTPEVQLRALHDKSATARFELMLVRRSVRQEVQAVLTPEQRAQAVALRSVAQARLRERKLHLRLAAGRPG